MGLPSVGVVNAIACELTRRCLQPFSPLVKSVPEISHMWCSALTSNTDLSGRDSNDVISSPGSYVPPHRTILFDESFSETVRNEEMTDVLPHNDSPAFRRSLHCMLCGYEIEHATIIDSNAQRTARAIITN